MYKKLLSIILVLCTVLSLTACNGVSAPEATTDTPTISETPTEAILTTFPSNAETTSNVNTTQNSKPNDNKDFSLDSIPQFAENPYYVINNNEPFFTGSELTVTNNGSVKSYEKYAPLDSLGRCGITEACIGIDIMPTEKRGEIGQVKPTGWHTIKYDCVDGKYLYNRCHLIGFQLTGENANERNLITGTRYMNVDGMLPFENMIDDYVEETKNHVLYRVTPIYEGDNLLAHGVLMEAKSVEDNGDGICFNVFCYNAQPGIEIDYKTGNSWLSDVLITTTKMSETLIANDYILNTNSKKIHLPSCQYANSMNPKNKERFSGTINELLEKGYSPCGSCKP